MLVLSYGQPAKGLTTAFYHKGLNMEVIIKDAPLGVKESTRLEELERVIDENFRGFVLVARALIEINQTQLYRNDEGRTFEQYCKVMFDLSRRRAYQLMDAGSAMNNLCKIFHNDELPRCEAQALELAKVAGSVEQEAVWNDVIRKYGNGKITAKIVRDEVQRFLNVKTEKKELLNYLN